MKTYEIVDGVVRNCIQIVESQRKAYERATGATLVDAEDSLGVANGDTYDSNTGAFARQGESLLGKQQIATRDRLLLESDHTQLLDYPATDQERAAWAAYRQALRDLTAQAGFPQDVVWPQKPTLSGVGDTVLGIVETLLGINPGDPPNSP